VNKQKITFIVNPVSGTGKQKQLEDSIEKHLDHSRFDFVIQYTQSPGHATELAVNAAADSYLIVAVGGDGTINEVAKALINTSIPLGIIPCGSGNGLATHYGIPVKVDEAVKLINNGKIIITDTALINGVAYLSTAGVGFDAHIAQKFNQSKNRGFSSYAKLVLTEWVNFKPLHFKFSADGQKFERTAFLTTIANCSQFGNNAFIAPEAKTDDGKLNVTIVKPFPFWAVPGLLRRLFNKKIHLSPFVETFTAKEIEIEQPSESVHYDGEFWLAGKQIKFINIPNSLKIFVPNF
jgi:diacylglycerol kinase (ATP)